MSKRLQISPDKQETLKRLLAQSGIGPVAKQSIPCRNIDLAPLSYSQQRMWFLYQFEADKALYNLPLALRLKGDLDVGALQDALNTIVLRHAVLRTRFAMTSDGLVQITQPHQPFELATLDLQRHASDVQDSELKRIIHAEMQTAFDLAKSPLMRAKLLRLGPRDHLLLLVMHHIGADGWSMGVLESEMAALYKANLEKTASPLPELPIQYADYAAWQRKATQQQAIDHQLNYWRKKLNGLPELLQLPAKQARPAVPDHRGAQHRFQLPPTLLHRLKELGRAQGATLFMVLLTAFQILLCRYTGQTDVAVGSPVAGRDSTETENLIGLFINILVMRTDLSGDPSLRQLLTRVREVALDAYSNQNVPFEKLVEEMQLKRDPSLSPLFQVMFILQNTPSRQWDIPGLTMEEQDVEIDRELFDVTLVMREGEQQMAATLIYRTDLFEPDLISQFALHFQTLLQSVVDDPERQVLSLPLLSGDARHHLLEDWCAGPQVPLSDACLHDLFQQQAELTPERIAAIDQEEVLTYAELDLRSNQLAHYLRRAGVGPEHIVAICVEPGVEMLVALLAILKAGGSYLPLDSEYPHERLQYVLSDSQARILITQQELLWNFSVFQGIVVSLDGDRAEIRQADASHMENLACPIHRAYVLYTSGSTGKPKGVEVSHASLVNFLLAMQRTPGIQAEDLCLAVTALTFDIAALELFLPLISGAKVRILSREIRTDASKLLQALTDDVSIVQATPATWTSLLNAGWNGNPRLKMLCGGEACTPELARKLLKRGGSLWNMYGPTETTIWSVMQNVKHVHQQVAIGSAITNTTVYVLDQEMEPAPLGVAAELYIGGAGIARAYLNRPELTAQRFVPDPFSRKAGDRLYRTGDMVRWTFHGDLEFVGRCDAQIKLRGHRIEPGEIESALREHHSVEDAVVVVRDCGPGDQRLVAYVAKKQGHAWDGEDLRSLLIHKLPRYMVPSYFVPLEKLPLTPSGKIDRRALPEPVQHGEKPGREYCPPVTPTEKKLAEIWADVMQLERVGVEDSFLELGGHSLLAMQITARVQQALGVEIPLFTLFEQRTLAEIACLIERQSVKGRNRPRSRPPRPSLQSAEIQ